MIEIVKVFLAARAVEFFPSFGLALLALAPLYLLRYVLVRWMENQMGWGNAPHQSMTEEDLRALSAKFAASRSFKVNSTIVLLVGLLLIGPIREELLFRAPMMFFFSSVNWMAIVVVSLVFAFLHWEGGIGVVLAKLRALEQNGFKGGWKSATVPIKTRIQNASWALALGVLYGYTALKTQSLWWAIALHTTWNAVGPIAIQLTLLGVKAITRRRRQRRREKQLKWAPRDY